MQVSGDEKDRSIKMIQSVKKWTLRLVLSGVFLLVLLVSFILNPSFLYAHKTITGNCIIYHNASIDSIVKVRINDAAEISKRGELYDANFKYDICLNDGSLYPSLIKTFFNDPFISTFYNKIILWGTINFKDNYGVEGTNKWNMTQAIAHAQTHCLQFNKLGLWKSNPIAGYPDWKWEGYAEYIARGLINNNNLTANIDRLIQAENKERKNWIEFSDGTGSSLTFYKRCLLIQFCSEIKKMNFDKLLKDTTVEEVARQEMMNWYNMNTEQ